PGRAGAGRVPDDRGRDGRHTPTGGDLRRVRAGYLRPLPRFHRRGGRGEERGRGGGDAPHHAHARDAGRSHERRPLAGRQAYDGSTSGSVHGDRPVPRRGREVPGRAGVLWLITREEAGSMANKDRGGTKTQKKAASTNLKEKRQ